MNTAKLRVKAAPRADSLKAGGAVLLLMLLLVGCGSGDGLERAAISGKVTVQGAPLVAGRILFVPLEPPGPTTSGPIVQGEYKLPKQQGPIVGKHRVEVEADLGIPPDDEAEFAKWRNQPPPAPVIPPAFNTNSTLVAEVGKRDNEFNISVPVSP